MTSGTVEFRQTEYNLDDTLTADFTWTDAHYNFTGDNYATASIYNPSGVLKKQYVEENDSEGSHTLSYTGDVKGTWRARLRIWNGSSWTDLSHYITVVGESPPPSPPPTPPVDTYTLTFKTTPGKCYVDIIGSKYGYSNSSGLITFTDLYKGAYTYEVSKTGYVTKSDGVYLDKDKTVPVTLEEEPPSPPPTPAECPDFWVDPVGAVLCWIISTIEEALGFVSGGFIELLSNAKSFFEDSWTQICDFFTDVTGNIITAVKDNLGSVIDWVSDNLTGFAEWISTISADALENLKTFLGDVGDFVATKFTDFISWLSELTGSIADYIGGAIGDFVDWTSDQLGSIWEGIQDWVLDMITGLIDSFQYGFDQGIEDQKNNRKK